VVIKKLIETKQEEQDKYLVTIENFLSKVNERIDKAVKDENVRIGINTSFVKNFEMLFEFDKPRYLNMDSKHRLLYAEKWFNEKDKDVKLFLERAQEEHKSVINEIDKQLQYYRGELERVNKELNSINPTGLGAKVNKWRMNSKKNKIERVARTSHAAEKGQ
jgi:hypothetical protein